MRYVWNQMFGTGRRLQAPQRASSLPIRNTANSMLNKEDLVVEEIGEGENAAASPGGLASLRSAAASGAPSIFGVCRPDACSLHIPPYTLQNHATTCPVTGLLNIHCKTGSATVLVNGCRQSAHQYFNRKQQNIDESSVPIRHTVSQWRTNSRVKVVNHANFRWMD